MIPIFTLVGLLLLLGLALCHRELRALRRSIAALDEGQGRRAAAIVAAVQGLREPLEAVRAGVEEMSPNRRDTAPPRTKAAPAARTPATAGLRIARAADEERDSDGETRLVRQPTRAELCAAGAARPSRALSPIPVSGVLLTVCRMCEGGGVIRARSGALEGCASCQGSGYLDPERQTSPEDERNAQLPG